MRNPRIGEINSEIADLAYECKQKVTELKAERRKLMREQNDHTPWFELLLKLVTVAVAVVLAIVVAMWVALPLVDEYLTDVSDLRPWLVVLAGLGGAFVGLHYVTRHDKFA